MNIKSLCSSLLFSLVIASTQAQEKVHIFPKDKDMYFREDCATSTYYYQFSTNGTYRNIDCEHMYVEEFDAGTWTQDKGTGQLTLTSKKGKQEFIHPILPFEYKKRIYLYVKDPDFSGLLDLPDIKKLIDQAKDRSNITFVWCQVDQATFEKESVRTQRFIFYPEMNNRILQKPTR